MTSLVTEKVELSTSSLDAMESLHFKGTFKGCTREIHVFVITNRDTLPAVKETIHTWTRILEARTEVSKRHHLADKRDERKEVAFTCDDSKAKEYRALTDEIVEFIEEEDPLQGRLVACTSLHAGEHIIQALAIGRILVHKEKEKFNVRVLVTAPWNLRMNGRNDPDYEPYVCRGTGTLMIGFLYQAAKRLEKKEFFLTSTENAEEFYRTHLGMRESGPDDFSGLRDFSYFVNQETEELVQALIRKYFVLAPAKAT